MPTFPAPLTHPLGPPTTSGTTITVDSLLNSPTRVTRIVADMVMSNFFLDRIFTTGGEVNGGAVLYDRVDTLLTYLDRDVERIEPGSEAPIVTMSRVAPRTAQVEKFGGKFPVTNEARRRNSRETVNNAMRRLANTIVRKMHQRGLAELAAAITEHARTAASAATWASAMTLTGTTSSPALRPARGFAQIQREAETNEMGYDYDTLIVNQAEAESLRVTYSDDLDQVLGDAGLDDFIVTPRKAAGSAYFLASGMVGGMRLEEPLRTTVTPEGAPLLREQDWVQSLVNPVMFVTDPFAVIELTGL